MDPGTGGSGGGPPPLLRILPLSGAGVPVMDPSGVCDAFASELVGNYVCMRGDGTSVLGSGVTLATGVGVDGTITTTAPRICPNGPDCAALPAQSFDGAVAYLASNHAAPPAGSFSVCLTTRVRSGGSSTVPFALKAGISYMQIGPGSIIFRLDSGPAATLGLGDPQGRWVFVCGTYRRVAAGSSVGNVYLDGAVGNQATTMPLPRVDDFPVLFGSAGSDIALALYTEKELSAATVAAMSAKVHGAAWAAADGTAMTYTRAGLLNCTGPDGRLTQLRANWPCITRPAGFEGPAFMSNRSGTNVMLFSEALNTWTATAATVTTNADVSPQSPISAERIFSDATNAEHYISRTPTLATGSNHIASVYLKAGTVSHAWLSYAGTRYAYANLAAGTATASNANDLAAMVPLADGWWRLVLVVKAANVSANPAINIGLSGVAGASSYPGTAADYVSAWGAQLVATAAYDPTEYVRSDATAVSSQTFTELAVASPVGMSNITGCARAVGLVASPVAVLPGALTATLLDFGTTSSVLVLGPTATEVSASDGTTARVASGANFLVAPIRARAVWGDSLLTASNGAIATTGAYDGSIDATNATYKLGFAHGGGSVLNGYIGDIAIGNDPNACN